MEKALTGKANFNIRIKQAGVFSIPPEQVHILKELGKWNRKHAEAVFGSLPGLPPGHFYGPSTLSEDSTFLYLFLPDRSAGDIMIKGLSNAIRDVEVVGRSQHLNLRLSAKSPGVP